MAPLNSLFSVPKSLFSILTMLALLASRTCITCEPRLHYLRPVLALLLGNPFVCFSFYHFAFQMGRVKAVVILFHPRHWWGILSPRFENSFPELAFTPSPFV